ncbi:hypothetical protein, partial [Mesorhizobium sp. M4A.F.Ca.ET.090.04.2.1]|uniref:hypothetical protein n=1 Tax=Mesorhizobium sp. M4A.F.Ca.ET.090.04.2.1 TaxID=2496663 RepID=UPI001AECB1E3
NRTNPQKYFVGIFVGYPCSCVGVNYLETKPDFLRFESASGHHPLLSRHSLSPNLLRFCLHKQLKSFIFLGRMARLSAFHGISAYLV